MAGWMIGIGATVYLSCENKYVGALLFCIGLFTICSFKLALFTGMCGYVSDEDGLIDLVFVWTGNFIGILIVALLMASINPEIHVLSGEIFDLKLQKNACKTLILSAMCGILMFIAVDIYRTRNNMSRYFGMFLCVPTFILCGFEHSIANMFYLTAGMLKSYALWEALFYILICSIGNMIGAIWSKLACNYVQGKK